MRRDWELVREIMHRLEALEPGQELRDGDLEGHDSRVVQYHFQIMLEAGLIETAAHNTLSGWSGIATRLTWEGHEFLDLIRSKDVWPTILRQLRIEGLGWSFHAIRMIAESLVKQAVIG